MYCKNCGEQIPENSKFCSNCGDEVITDNAGRNQNRASPQPGEFYTPEYQGGKEVQAVTEAESEKIKNRSFKFAAGFFISAIVLCIWAVSASSPEDAGSISTATAAVSVAQTAVSSEPALSPRQQQIEDVFENQAQWQFEGTIKRLLKNPDTANFTHDKSSWVADNAILTGGGTVSYKNAKGQTVSEPFTVSIIMNNESYFPLYVELNKIVSSNILDEVDSAGCATRLGVQEFGVAEGNSIFQQNSDKVVTIMYEEGKQSTPSKPSASATPSQAQPSKGQSGNNQDYSGWIKYSTDDLETLLTYIAQGDVVCIDGQYYCSPRLANQKEVIVYTYDAASDPNYPRN
ncbi:zinc ribbon domain-containing protein [Faecalispora anaeroviscerum]|uniref:zinc ribbon domain-containing protein n=1 Tax=Faecalispora anaeroviscerum TaxID=2991836 RepID=UPI0024BB0F51|nr:zinc ribbon domain-containing protein [Faecalispora anaeroviscerum]